jgi:RNA polymerase sigma-70 factor (ECF subfamily)
MGNVTSFEELYRRFAPDVFRFALYLSADRALAEDITSETFVRAWTSPSAIRTSTVKAYLLAIARNLYVDERRRRRRDTELPESLPDRSDLARTTGMRDALERTARELQRIPEGYRTALLMWAQEEMTYEEIAAALGISLAAVKTRIFRARLRLAELKEVLQWKA